MNYFKEMLKLQDSFNYKTVEYMLKFSDTYKGRVLSSEWKDNGFDWVNYMMIEASEQNSSLDFKHWKAGMDDLDNFKVEVIDNWHFLMSLGLQRYSVTYLQELYETFWLSSMDKDLEDSVDLQVSTQFFAYKVLGTKFDNFRGNYSEALFTLFEIMQELEILDVKDLYREYLVKNVLNEVRQIKGYKEGTYIKMWTGNDGKLYEDNVVTYEISYDMHTLTYDGLKQELIKFYDNMKKGE